MANYYNLDGIKTELQKELNKTKALLQAWKNVTFPTKKDGTPFANMQKNIDGAKYTSISYAMQPGEYELNVYTFADGYGYINDTVYCYELVKYLKDDNKLSKKQNYMEKQSYLEQVYKYDLDDVKQAVTDRINYLHDRILTLKAQQNIVDYCYNEFYKMYDKALKELENNCASAGSVGYSNNKNDIYYMILDTIKERYPYC